jgi:hypothetical protein
MMLKKILIIICVFVLGILAANIYSRYVSAQNQLQLPDNNGAGGYEFKLDDAGNILKILENDVQERPSPKDRVAENQILVTNDKVVINLKDAQWASFTDTNSMDPVIDGEANAIEIAPKSEDDVQVGDIVSYISEYSDGIIIHRVAGKAKDDKGTYFTMKGDNNPANDPGRVRFSQIKSVVVAIIY